MKKVKPGDVRKAQETLEAMASELGIADGRIMAALADHGWEIAGYDANERYLVIYADTLIDAHIALLHKIANTEEAPF